ncbi:Pex24p-domain-containing protein [Aulographum hederae CBS 113979]|uniref:Pex24p-domain-containing protein n=1 Tax=Aulographum hederae CBS 113979 TaxID=1176131 RepID=A0A6G1GMT1_9PEZI|nr:Pex24p-domain-containing protein [Aulographum hederae CBS 113979]
MAALDTPWLDLMSSPLPGPSNNGSPTPNGDPNPPTFAAFSPATLSRSSPLNKQRSTILVHQKSPLLVATPPQITRTLAYSHPFVVPLNKFVGLLSWTTGDPWESFLLVAFFWGTTLYGDAVMRFAGPVVLATVLILGMYVRRYSPLSSTGWTGEKGQKARARSDSDAATKHHKSLDEIVDTLKLFTSRCNILLDPFLRLTDFLSTQQTATSATTRPALTAFFLRILLLTPIWIGLTLPPLQIITTKRVILTLGTIILSFHSRPARVSRTILWRSRIFRRSAALITGLNIPLSDSESQNKPPPLPPRRSGNKTANDIASSLLSKRRPDSPGIRFTFTLYENQRRWLGIGWTSSMLAYERAAWTDEHLSAAVSKDRFELPEVEGGMARWRWADGSQWRLDGVKSKDEKEGKAEEDAWVYYDNKWHDPRKGKDGWGRYTRRRKWYRDAELVEVTPSTEITPSPTPRAPFDPSFVKSTASLVDVSMGAQSEADTDDGDTLADDTSSTLAPLDSNTDDVDTASTTSGSPSMQRKKKGWFKRKDKEKNGNGNGNGEGKERDRAASVNSQSAQTSGKESGGSGGSRGSGRDEEQDVLDRFVGRREEESGGWGLGEDARMGLG